MTLQATIGTSIGLGLLLASVSFAQQVKTDYDHDANFSQYKTYSWTGVKTQQAFWTDRIKDAVNAALAAKGWTQVPSDGDVAIVAIGTTQNQQTLDTFYDGFGGWRWRGFGDVTTTVEAYQEGTLVIDLFDASTKTLLWRGSSSETVSDKPDKNIKNLDKGVKKLFEHFPPDSSKR
jgi:hypothetical protein